MDRCVTPWLVVAMHRPMYVPFPHKSNRVVGQHLQVVLLPTPLNANIYTRSEFTSAVRLLMRCASRRFISDPEGSLPTEAYNQTAG